MSSATVDDTHREQRADLELLAAELRPRGFKTVLVTRDGRLPGLEVVNGQRPGLSGRVYASADDYWWSTAEAIAPRDQPAEAAEAIARVLAVRAPGR